MFGVGCSVLSSAPVGFSSRSSIPCTLLVQPPHSFLSTRSRAFDAAFDCKVVPASLSSCPQPQKPAEDRHFAFQLQFDSSYYCTYVKRSRDSHWRSNAFGTLLLLFPVNYMFLLIPPLRPKLEGILRVLRVGESKSCLSYVDI